MSVKTTIFEFEHYVGYYRAKELGISGWTVPGIVKVTTSVDALDFGLTVEADGEVLTIKGWIDQWGTYYDLKSGKGSREKTIAQVENRPSFLSALIAGLQTLRDHDPFSKVDHNEVG